MVWHLLLSQDEQDLYEYHIESYLRNAATFVGINFLGYIICTLLFLHELTVTEHVVFGATVFIGGVSLYLYLRRRFNANNQIPIQSSVVRLVVLNILWLFWWNAYFFMLSRSSSPLVLQQFIIIMTMISTISIAMMGRFQRLATIALFITFVFMAIVGWVRQVPVYSTLLLQGCILALSQLLFMRSLNQQLSDLFRLKDQNLELVDALKQKNIALEQSNLSQSRYLSAASHDLRQPLHALALLTSDAQRKNAHPEVATTLLKIEQAIDSLSQSFNAMLNLSRLDAGVVKPEFQALPVQRVLNRLRVEFEEVAREKGLDFRVVPTKVWVQSDEGMLHSILSNFVSNAIRYTESGSVLLGVRHAKAGLIHINIYDTGTGVPAEKARQIFQEYQRLEYAQQRVKGGVGLGLAISERMARLLGVQLLVQSVPDKGSCFGLTLMPTAAPQVSLQKAKEREQVSDHISGRRVAILDDDETAIDHLDELLSSWGLEVSIALSSDMLKEMIEEDGAFDLILSDYHLGLEHENGLDVLIKSRQWQSQHPAKCVLVTGDTSAELTQAVQAQNIEILYKPLRPVRLRAYLNTLLA